MSDIRKNYDKGKEKTPSSSGKKFDVVRSQHHSQSERQRKHEKQLSGTPSERRSRLTSSLAPTKDLISPEFKKLNIGEKKKNSLEATYSERRYRKISSLAPIRDFTGSRVQERRKMIGGMDKEDTSKQQEENAKQKQEKAHDEAYRVKEYQSGINYYMANKHQDSDRYLAGQDTVDSIYDRKVAEANEEYNKSVKDD